jgi:branched-chain amino acid transport system substrate-binding protein
MKLTGIVLLVALITGAAGCGEGPRQAAKDPIRIGAAVSVTGAYAEPGNYVREGYSLWAKDLNARGGLLGRRVELTLYDDKSEPPTCVAHYQKLILEDKVDLVLGPFGSPNVTVVSTVTEKLGYPLPVYAVSEEIWKRGYRYVFGVPPPAAHYMDGALAVAKQHGLERIAVIDAQSDPGLHDVGLGVLNAARETEFRVVFYDAYAEDTADFSWLMARAKAAAPDALLVSGYPKDEIAMTRELKRLDFMPKLYATVFGGILPQLGVVLGRDAEGVLGVSHWEPDASFDLPGATPFIEAFQRDFGRPPNGTAAFGYAAGQLLEAAVTKVASLDREKIRDALAALDTVTVYGHYKVDKDGQQIGHDVLLIQWQRGKKVVVWPDRLASGKLIFPVPSWHSRN